MRYLPIGRPTRPPCSQPSASPISTTCSGRCRRRFSEPPIPACRLTSPNMRSKRICAPWRPATTPPATGRSFSAPAPIATTCRPRVDHLIQRSEWLTAYTPYQPEISQGTLQMLFEFQTQVAHLTGMEVANASMYDGSTATAEAVLMARRLTRRNRLVLSGGLHPHYRDVVRTYAGDEDLVCLPPRPKGRATSSTRSMTRPPRSSSRRRISTAICAT